MMRLPPVSLPVILVVAAPPDSGAHLVASLGSAVKPLVSSPQGVQSARKGRIRVVHRAIAQRERAHARRLARVSQPIGADAGRNLGERFRIAGLIEPMLQPSRNGLEPRDRTDVVFARAGLLLLLCE